MDYWNLVYIVLALLGISILIVAFFIYFTRIPDTIFDLTDVIISLYESFFKEKIENNSLDSFIKDCFEEYSEADIITLHCKNGEYESEIEICRSDDAAELLKVYLIAIEQTMDYCKDNWKYIQIDSELFDRFKKVESINNIIRIERWKKVGQQKEKQNMEQEE